MTPILYSAFLLFLTATGLAGADSKHVVFDSHARTREKSSTEYVPTLMHEFPVSEHKWPLKELNPDLPSDWSPFRFLVMEVNWGSVNSTVQYSALGPGGSTGTIINLPQYLVPAGSQNGGRFGVGAAQSPGGGRIGEMSLKVYF